MSNFRKLLTNGNGLGTFTKEEIDGELRKRDISKNVFPLDVFHDLVKPYINALNKHMDIPASFIGLALLSSYSTAIGTAFAVTTNGRDMIHLPVWGALIGISSSGKSIALNNIFKPLDDLQNIFDVEWEEKTRGLKDWEINSCRLFTVIYRDAHIPTLVKSVLPDNPKGLVKFSDELLEWINGMNQLSKKEGTDEQFWISSWNCMKYSGIRSGKQKFVIKRPFVNVIGGAQYSVLSRMFSKDRDTTGFIFRLLFALTEVDKIAEPDPSFEIPKEWYERHKTCIDRLYKNLPVDSFEDDPSMCMLTPEAVKQYQIWTKAKIRTINAIEDLDERDIHSGILGKIKEYALRFAAILHLADKALDSKYDAPSGYEDFGQSRFLQRETITGDFLRRGLKVADYFFTSAVDTYNIVQQVTTAPIDVLTAARLQKQGKSLRDMTEILWGSRDNASKQKLARLLKRWIKDYPRVFNAIPK